MTHNFYRYPARFSPLFVREAIKTFSSKNDWIFDPFMGGGTTLVEASVIGRRAIGTDISSLASFISKVKTTILCDDDLENVVLWVENISGDLNLHKSPVRAIEWLEKGYQRNISGKGTWPIRKLLELALSEVLRLSTPSQQNFVRCLLLKTAQWALDCRGKIPTATEFRQQLLIFLDEMVYGALEYRNAIKNSWGDYRFNNSFPTLCLNKSIIGFEEEYRSICNKPPKLIVTSPPYPNVHVLYHRWQVQGRKETPAPYWIANLEDGNGSSFYTFGPRYQKGLKTYFEMVTKAFLSISKLVDDKTILIQMISFPEPSWQLSKYLDVMEETGFQEIFLPGVKNSSDGRLWRQVPNRRWYANKQEGLLTSSEVVLCHKKQ
ncbi:MAG: site-specific DNA-methyltransferase [Patescibacteria group bacterium]|nr:site-specific DNA-methyltransferase [Patescibacteria group bacterium]